MGLSQIWYDGQALGTNPGLWRELASIQLSSPVGIALPAGFWLHEINSENHPEFAEAVGSGKFEIIAGSLTGAALPLLPRRDRLGQLEAFAEACSARFGAVPVAAWLPESGWEPDFPQLLVQAGYRYLWVSPEIAQAFNSEIPFVSSDEDCAVIVLPYQRLSDLEVAGIPLPGYGLAGTIPENPNLHFGPSLLPDGKPGTLRNMVLQSAEIYDLWGKMLYGSGELEAARRPPAAAYEHLYWAQAAGAYSGDPWALRAAWRELIRVENASEPRKYAWIEGNQKDWEPDGNLELAVESHTLSAYFRPARGGSLAGFDVRRASWPLLLTAGNERNLLDFLSTGDGESAPVHQLQDQPYGASRYADRVTLSYSGLLVGQSVEIRKVVQILHRREALAIEWSLTNRGSTVLEGSAGFSLYFPLPAPDVWPASALDLSKPQRYDGPAEIEFYFPGIQLKVRARLETKDSTIFHLPTPEGFSWHICRALDLLPGRSRRISLEIDVAL